MEPGIAEAAPATAPGADWQTPGPVAPEGAWEHEGVNYDALVREINQYPAEEAHAPSSQPPPPGYGGPPIPGQAAPPPPPAPPAQVYDLTGARAAGVPDAEIANVLAPKFGYDLAGARKAGVPDAAIADLLGSRPIPEADSGYAGVFGAAVQNIIPTAAGVVGAGPGAIAGMGIGSFGGPLAPLTVPVGGIVGGVLGYLAGSKVGDVAEQAVESTLPREVKAAIGILPEQQAAAEAQHPNLRMLAGLAPGLAFFGIGAGEKAAVDAGASTLTKFWANPITARATGAGIQTTMEAVHEERSGEGFDPTRLAIAATAGAAFGKPTALGEAAQAVIPRAIAPLLRPRYQAVADVTRGIGNDAVTEDDTIKAAAAAAQNVTPVDVAEHAATVEAAGDQHQAKLLRMFRSAVPGDVTQGADGGYQVDVQGTTVPIQVWNPDAPPAPGASPTSTVPRETATAIRDHYADAGVDVVFYQDHPDLPFDGAVDKAQPNTVFISNNPQRAVAQVAGHEFTHVLADTTLPDGRNLGDILNQQIAASITPAGQRYAAETFGATAPKRDVFPIGPDGDQAHADAVQAHLVNELGADIGAEAPKFQGFMQRTIDAIQTRYGDNVATGVLAKLIDGLKTSIDTIKGFFGDRAGTQSQNWVTNLSDIHDTLAQMHAARFGTEVERTQAEAVAATDRATRDAFLSTQAPEVPRAPVPEAQPPPPPQIVQLLRQTEGAILRRVGGDETALSAPAAARLDEVRGLLDRALRPPEPAVPAAAVPEAEVPTTTVPAAAPAPAVAQALEQARAADPEAFKAREAALDQLQALRLIIATESRPQAGVATHVDTPTVTDARLQLVDVERNLAEANERANAAARDALTQAAVTQRRWFGELTGEAKAAAAATPQATVLQQTAAAILRPVDGNADALAPPQAARLAAVQTRLDAAMRPVETPQMAILRQEMQATQEAIAQGALPKPEVPGQGVLFRPKEREAPGATFASPNVAEQLDFPNAVAGLASTRQRIFETASKDIDVRLGLQTRDTPAVGAWADGAENSLVTKIAGATWDKTVLGAAMKGALGLQKAVIAFQNAPAGADGPAMLSSFHAIGDLATIQQNLLKDGVEFHTLAPTKTGADIYVVDFDGSAANAVRQAAERYGQKPFAQPGRAELIGTQLGADAASDAEQRADARSIFDRVIQGSRVPDAVGHWNELHNTYGSTLDLGSQDLGVRKNLEQNLTNVALLDPRYPGMERHPDGTEGVARDLLDRGVAALKNLGVASGKITGPSVETDPMLARALVTEIKAAHARSGNAVGWYTTNVQQAMAVASTIHPEITADPNAPRLTLPTGEELSPANARMAFTSALAITSQNVTVPINSTTAERAYDVFKQTGRFPTDIVLPGKAAISMNANFVKLNSLIDNLGFDGAREFLSKDFTVRDLDAYGYGDVSGERKSTLVQGSAIFGPKIGQGFYQNLNGNYDPVTMDLWFMRGWGRLTGTLFDTTKPAGQAAQQTKFENALAAGVPGGGIQDPGGPAGARYKQTVEAALSQPVPQTPETLRAMADRITDAWESMYNSNGEAFRSGALPKPDKPAAVATAIRLIFGQSGIKEAPTGGKERDWIRSVWDTAREQLGRDGLDLTNADMQALWWYPEKTLYGKLGGKDPTGLNVDYASALSNVARNKGVSDATIADAIGSVAAAHRGPGPAGEGDVTGGGGPGGEEGSGGNAEPAAPPRPIEDIGKEGAAEAPPSIGLGNGVLFSPRLDKTERLATRIEPWNKDVEGIVNPTSGMLQRLFAQQTDPNPVVRMITNSDNILVGDGYKFTHQDIGVLADTEAHPIAAGDTQDWLLTDQGAPGENTHSLGARNVLVTHLDDNNTATYPPPESWPAGLRRALGMPPVAPAATDVQFSPRITGADRETEAYTPEQVAAFKNVGRITEDPTWGQRWAAFNTDLGRRTIATALDPYIGVKRDDPAGYVALRMANTTSGANQAFMTDGTLKFDGVKYAMDTRNGGVQNYLVKPLQGEENRFLWWVGANRADRLTAEGRENLWTPDNVTALKTLNQGTVPFDYTLPNGTVTNDRATIYADSLRKLDVFNRNVLDLGVQSGLLKRAQADVYLQNPFYVPFYRMADTDTHFVGPTVSAQFVKQYASKRLQGGTAVLNHDLWENAQGNWAHMIDASLKNRAANQVLDTAVTNGAAAQVTPQQYDGMTNEQKANTTWTMVGGVKQYTQVTDPMLYTAVSALNYAGDHSALMNVGSWFARTLRAGVTANPLFTLRVSIRDAEQAAAVSPTSYNLLDNVVQGFKASDFPGALANVVRAVAGRDTHELSYTDQAANLIAAGGVMRLGSNTETGYRQTNLDTMLNTPNALAAFWGVKTAAEAYKELTAQAEDVQRFALNRTMLAQGNPNDVMGPGGLTRSDLAAFAARDLEDFTLKGAGTAVRTITQLVPFMNAWAQGLYKVGRSAANMDQNIGVAVGQRVATQASARVGIVLTATTLATLALDAIYKDDPDYMKRTENDRNSNFWFKFGGTQYRIPMGFEVAALSRIAANGVEAIMGTNEMTGRRFTNNLISIFASNMAMNPVPQALKPLYDLGTNTSGTGSPIVPKGMEGVQPEYQYTGNTTLAARGVANVVNPALRGVFGAQAPGVSPMQLDYLTGAYFGWLGSMITGTADRVAREAAPASMAPARPAMDLWNFATGGMVSTQPTSASRYVDMLYSQGGMVNKAFDTFHYLISTGRVADAQQLLAENRQAIGQHALVGAAEKFEATENQMARRVEFDPNRTPEQKRVALMAIDAQRNRMAEQVYGGARAP